MRPVEAAVAVDAQTSPTAPWKTLRVFHELPQGLFPSQAHPTKTRKSTGHWASWSPFSQFRTHMNCRRAENLPVEQFIPQFPIERFHIAVLPGVARLDEQRLHLQGREPQADELRRELRTVIGANMGGDPLRDEQVREGVEHIGRSQAPGDDQRETFPRVLIDDREESSAAGHRGSALPRSRTPKRGGGTRAGGGCTSRQ